MERPIGRNRECDRIIEFLDALASGRGGVLFLEGEGGTGKTTLAQWALDHAVGSGMSTISGRSWERAQSVPYEPLVAGIGRMLRTRSTDVRHELVAGLSSLGQLFDGLELAPVATEATGNRARLHDAIATLLARHAETQPVLVYLDDLHWTDTASIAAVQFLCRDLPYVQLGVVATVRPVDADARPEVRGLISALRRADVTTSIAVRNLDREETEAVLRSRLDGHLPERLIELVWARSAGTPLVVHELIDDLLDRGTLVESGPGWVLTEREPAPPGSLRDLISDRLDQLDPTARRVLEVLAVADDSLNADALHNVTGLTADVVTDALATLRDRRLASEVVHDQGPIAWCAEHPIISSVVAAELTELVRQRIHRHLLRGDTSATLARQARHIIGSGTPDAPVAAVDTLIAAADEAAIRGEPTEAIRLGETAERLLGEWGDGGQRQATQLRLDERIGRWRVRERQVVPARAEDNQVKLALDRLTRVWDACLASGDLLRAADVYRELDRGVFLSGQDPLVVLRDRFNELVQAAVASGDDRLVLNLRSIALTTGMRDNPFRDDLKDLVDAVLEAGARVDSDESRLAVELATISRGSGTDAPTTVERLFDLDHPEVPWELRNRLHLAALDAATTLGDRALLDESLSRLRHVEQQMGTPPNWRQGFLRGWFSVHDEGTLDDLGVIQRAGTVNRAAVLVALLEALAERYRVGPGAALEQFDQTVGGLIAPDAVARINIAVGRLLLVRGHERESELAEAAIAAISPIQNAPSLTRALSGAIAHGRLRAITLARPGDVAAARQSAGDYAAGRGTLHAVVLESEAAGAGNATQQAELLLEAASVYESQGLALLAADRVTEAAEASRSAVPDDRLERAAARAASCGATWIADRVAALGIPDHAPYPHDTSLTRREWEVASEVAKGLTNREVGTELFISIRTVTSHLDHIYTKLGISSRAELTTYVDDTGGAAT